MNYKYLSLGLGVLSLVLLLGWVIPIVPYSQRISEHEMQKMIDFLKSFEKKTNSGTASDLDRITAKKYWIKLNRAGYNFNIAPSGDGSSVLYINNL